MPKLHLNKQDLLIVVVDHLINIVKKSRDFEKYANYGIYIEMN